MTKATYLTDLKPEKAALLIIFSLQCDPKMQPQSLLSISTVILHIV